MRKQLVIYSNLLVFLIILNFFTSYIFHNIIFQYFMILAISVIYYKLHTIIYFFYQRTWFMTILCFIGLLFTYGIIGSLICLYTVTKAIKRINELKLL